MSAESAAVSDRLASFSDLLRSDGTPVSCHFAVPATDPVMSNVEAMGRARSADGHALRLPRHCSWAVPRATATIPTGAS